MKDRGTSIPGTEANAPVMKLSVFRDRHIRTVAQYIIITIDLKLKKTTPGELPDRRPVGRPRKQEESMSAPIAKRPVGRPRKQPDNTKSDAVAPASEMQNQCANSIASETPTLVPEAAKSDSIEGIAMSLAA
jgi:hypothetical protein